MEAYVLSHLGPEYLPLYRIHVRTVLEYRYQNFEWIVHETYRHSEWIVYETLLALWT